MSAIPVPAGSDNFRFFADHSPTKCRNHFGDSTDMVQCPDGSFMSKESWDETRMFLFESMKDLKAECAVTRKEIAGLRQDVTALKVKASFWGLIAGFLSGFFAKWVGGGH